MNTLYHGHTTKTFMAEDVPVPQGNFRLFSYGQLQTKLYIWITLKK
jgi:hypothetical protein